MINITDFKNVIGEALHSVHELILDRYDDPIEFTLLKFSGEKFIIIRNQSSWTTHGGLVWADDNPDLIKWLDKEHGIKPQS